MEELETTVVVQFQALMKICATVEYHLLCGGAPDKVELARLCQEGFSTEAGKRLLAKYHELMATLGSGGALASTPELREALAAPAGRPS